VFDLADSDVCDSGCMKDVGLPAMLYPY